MKRAVTFALVGASTMLVNSGAVWALSFVMTRWYAVTLGYALALAYNFALNWRVTFSGLSSPKTAVWKFLVVAALCYPAQLVIVYLAGLANIPPHIGVILSMPVTFAISYGLSSAWAFR